VLPDTTEVLSSAMPCPALFWSTSLCSDVLCSVLLSCPLLLSDPPCSPSCQCEYIYVLELEKKKFYVGKTRNLRRRLAEHLDGMIILPSPHLCTFTLSYLSTYLPICLSTCLPICLSTFLPSYLPTFSSSCLPTFPPSHLHTFLWRWGVCSALFHLFR
jgi:hypothetical protein